MKTSRFLVALCSAVLVLIASSVLAVPVESVESARATVSLQKIDSFLSEQIVAEQLKSLGVTKEQVDQRLVQLSDAQLDEIAAQIDELKAGGMIQGGAPNPLGPIGCVFKQIGTFLSNVVRFLFCWTDQEQ